jgi:hypothetical protein
MSRIFLGLATLNTLALVGSFAVGFMSQGRVGLGAAPPLSTALWAFTIHLISGLFAAVLTLLVHSLVFTYFIGTGRWVQEVVTAYRLRASLWDRARDLKLRALPFMLGSIGLVIGTATLGAASDRGLLDGTLHLMLAVVAIGFNLWSYFREYQSLRANGELIAEIMSEVSRMREQRALDVARAMASSGDPMRDWPSVGESYGASGVSPSSR